MKLRRLTNSLPICRALLSQRLGVLGGRGAPGLHGVERHGRHQLEPRQASHKLRMKSNMDMLTQKLIWVGLIVFSCTSVGVNVFNGICIWVGFHES